MTVTLCVLLWANAGTEDELSAYEDQVLALLPDHGGRVLQRMRTIDRDAEQPCEVQIVEFPTPAALDSYLADDRRTALGDLRERAIARTEVLRVEQL